MWLFMLKVEGNRYAGKAPVSAGHAANMAAGNPEHYVDPNHRRPVNPRQIWHQCLLRFFLAYALYI